MSQPEDILLEQLKVKLEYPVECAKDILNHSGEDMKNVNCDLIDIKEEFTYLELENVVEEKYEDLYGFVNQWKNLEDKKEGDLIIKTDEGIKDEFKCADRIHLKEEEKPVPGNNDVHNEFKCDDFIHLKKEEKPVPGFNDVHFEPTENVIVAELNNKSVKSSTLRKRRRKSKISFSCDLCNSSFTTKLGLIIHIRRHLGDKPYQCHQCATAFMLKSHLTRHTRIHTGERPYQCHHCQKRFAGKSILSNHIIFIHMKMLNRYWCNYCAAKFVRRENLSRHKKRYHDLVDKSKRCNDKKCDNQRPECYHCGDTFCTKRTLVKHIMRRHTGERPYSCSYCGARFICSYSLIQHERRHTGERPYKCDKCDAKFARNNSLTRHMNIHTGDKHQCRYCTVKVTHKRYLVVHERIHTNDRRYRCEKCIDRFTRSGNLKSHMKSHTNEGPYMCSACKVGFHRKVSFNRHLKIHALEEKTKQLY